MLWKQVKASSHPDPLIGSYVITSKGLRTTWRPSSSEAMCPKQVPSLQSCAAPIQIRNLHDEAGTPL